MSTSNAILKEYWDSGPAQAPAPAPAPALGCTSSDPISDRNLVFLCLVRQQHPIRSSRVSRKPYLQSTIYKVQKLSKCCFFRMFLNCRSFPQCSVLDVWCGCCSSCRRACSSNEVTAAGCTRPLHTAVNSCSWGGELTAAAAAGGELTAAAAGVRGPQHPLQPRTSPLVKTLSSSAQWWDNLSYTSE